MENFKNTKDHVIDKLAVLSSIKGSVTQAEISEEVFRASGDVEHNEVIFELKQKGIVVVKHRKDEIWYSVREWMESILIAFILAMFIRTFFIQAFKIPSGSMRMTLIEGDRLMVNKLRYGPKIPLSDKRIPGYSEPQRGDIIVFVYPEDPERDFIKRLIAFGGETVHIENGDIYINNDLVRDPKIKNIFYYNRGSYGQSQDAVLVPEGEVFVLGDNSSSSHDSRYWGFVPEENIIGRAEVIYWPFSRVRMLN